jgi:ribosomal protein L21E
MLLPAEDYGDVFTPDQQREHTTAQIKQNLLRAQERMKLYAVKNGIEQYFEVGDMVYIKLQPYRHTSLSLHRCLKLHSKYYGPFKVLATVGNTSYKLLLPEECKLHHTFYLS